MAEAVARPGPGPRALLEREQALSALARTLDAGGVLLVRGPEGIGKSALLRHGLAGRTAPEPVLVAAPTRSGRLAPYGVTAQLLGIEIAAARRAAGVRAEPGARPTVALERRAGENHRRTVDLLTERLVRPGAVLAIDDAHRCDERSAAALVEAVGRARADDATVRMVLLAQDVADRPGARALGRLLGLADRSLELAPLTRAATAALVGRTTSRTDRRQADPAGVHERSGGVPLRIGADVPHRAVGGEHRRRATDGVGHAADVLRAIRVLTEVLPRATAPAVAAVAAVPPQGTAADLGHLRRAGLVLEDGDGWRLAHDAFATEPSLDAAGDEDAMRRRAAAWVTRALPHREDLAAHLLLPTAPAGDAETVEHLLRAAHLMASQGVADLSVEMLRRAAAEPPTPAQRVVLEIEHGLAARAAGEPAAARRHLERADARAREPDGRRDAALALAEHLLQAGETGDALLVLERAADALPLNAPQRLALEREILGLGQTGELEAATAMRRARALRALPGYDHGGALAAHVDALLLPEEGSVADVARRVSPHAALDADLLRQAVPTAALGLLWTLVRAELWDDAEQVIAALRAHDGLGVASPERGVVAAMAAHVELQCGDPRTALALAREPLERMATIPWAFPLRFAAAAAARAAVACDEPQEALRLLALVQPDHARPVAPGPVRPAVTVARAEALLAAGEHDRALRDALAVGRQQREIGAPNPSALPWAGVAAAALVRRAEHHRARRLVARDLGQARRWRSPLAISTALRALAVVSPEEAVRALDAAEDLVGGSRLRLERLRLAGARRALVAAGAVAVPTSWTIETTDAALARERASTFPELTPPPQDVRASATDDDGAGDFALTARQVEVARLVATGRTNDEIAGELELSTRTVQTHVRDILRRTGSRRRTEAVMKLRSVVAS